MADDRFLWARLRLQLDDDIYEGVKELDSRTRSELVRTGVRLALGIRTQKVQELREVPLPKLFFPGRRK